MRKILLYLLDGVLSSVQSRAALQLEVIALRHQLEVLQRTRPARVRLTRRDRIIWLLLYRLWPRCLDAVVIVKPETVIAWHHKGIRAFWAWRSCPRRRGRPPVPAEIRTLIRRITRENPLWGAPRVHGDLLKLGIEISQAAVSNIDSDLQEPAGRRSTATWCRRARFSASSRLRDLSSEARIHHSVLTIPIIDRDHVTVHRVVPSPIRIEFSVTTTER